MRNSSCKLVDARSACIWRITLGGDGPVPNTIASRSAFERTDAPLTWSRSRKCLTVARVCWAFSVVSAPCVHSECWVTWSYWNAVMVHLVLSYSCCLLLFCKHNACRKRHLLIKLSIEPLGL